MGLIKDKISTLLLFGYLSVMCLLIITLNADYELEVENESSFSYVDGAPNGPQNWGNLNPAWMKCGNGRRQSPVDISVDGLKLSPGLGPLSKHYKPAPAIIRNKGHYIADDAMLMEHLARAASFSFGPVEWRGDAGSIIINGIEFKLQQVHWHIPSEHTLNGERYAMEQHIVHSNGLGGIAVISVLYGSGAPDSFLERLLPYLATGNKEGMDLGDVLPSDMRFNVGSYYRYNGSLTTPPCSEDVIWTLAQEVFTVSTEQLRALRYAVDDGADVGNARPIQPLNGRTIYEFRFPSEKLSLEI